MLHFSSSSEASARTEAAAEGGEAGLVSRVLGLPGGWWGARETVSSAWGLGAAGLSSVLVGASVLPQLAQVSLTSRPRCCVLTSAAHAQGPRATSRRDEVTERIYRGVVAQPHSWPWVAKLKVGHCSYTGHCHYTAHWAVMMDKICTAGCAGPHLDALSVARMNTTAFHCTLAECCGMTP